MGVRRHFSDDVRGDTKIVSVRLPVDLVNKIDEYLFKYDIANRTLFIEEACKQRLFSLKCPSCHALNPENGKKCSVCGADLDTFKRALSEFEELYTATCDTRENVLKTTKKTLKDFDDLDKIAQELRENKEVRHIILPRIKMQIERIAEIQKNANKGVPVLSGTITVNGEKKTVCFTETESDILEISEALIFDPSSLSVPNDKGNFRPLTDEERFLDIKKYTVALYNMKKTYESYLDDLDWLCDIYNDINTRLVDLLKKDVSENT